MTVILDARVIDEIMAVKDGEEGCSTIRRLRMSLRLDTRLRELGPLMIKPLANVCSSCGDEVRAEAELTLLEISNVSKYHESFTFLIEEWVQTRKANQSLRPVLLRCLTTCLSKASKGPLSRNKTQYVVQLCSLILSDYFSPTNTIPDTIIDGLFDFLKETCDDNVFTEEHSRNEMAVICRRDMLSVLLLRLNKYLLNQKRTERVEDLHREFFSGSAKYSEMYRLILGRAKSLRESEADNVAYIDLRENDVAWFVSASASISSFPVVMTAEFRNDLLSRACANHIKAGEASVASDNFIVASKSYSSDCTILADMINIAVTAPPKDGPLGDPQGLSMCQRSAVYSAYVNVMSRLPLLTVMDFTFRSVTDSRNDTVVGMFIKAAKDKWSQSATHCSACVELFMKLCRNILASEFAISDATDSLTGILNWTRFILIKDKSIISDHAEFFKGNLDILCRKVDAELEATDMQTRVLLIASLLRRVRELF